MMKIKNKRGVSEVVSTVLIILVGILVVSIVGIWILNMVRDNTAIENLNLNLYIDSTQGQPCYNSALGKLVVGVTRSGGENANITGIKMVATMSNGKSISVVNKIAMGNLETYRYSIFGLSSKPQYVKVAPIVRLSNGREKEVDLSRSEAVVEGECDYASDTNSGIVLDDSNSPNSVPSPSKNLSAFN